MGGDISSRLIFSIILQMVILVVIGLIAYTGMNRVSNPLIQVSQAVNESFTLGQVGETLRGDLLKSVNGLVFGAVNWEQVSDTVASSKTKIQQGWERHLASVDAKEREHLQEEYEDSLNKMDEMFAELNRLIAARDRGQLQLFVANDLDYLIDPFFKTFAASMNLNQEETAKNLQAARIAINTFTVMLVVVGLIGILGSLSLSVVTYRAIAKPLNQLTATVQQVGEGNYAARTGLAGADELSELGRAFDQMLDARVASLVQVEQENERLNDSIIHLLQAVSQLSQRDLTVKVPVTEDVTGPVADALNLLTSETAKVLQGVTRISEEVAVASDKVKAQSDTVIAVAETERQAVERTAAELASAASAMRQIAELAQNCNTTAEAAIKTTQAALQTVTGTVNGISSTRDTIRETEKRIKRLGERSQEISGVVNLINTIAERTHILALNASMHAASAGEAGRGFAVVADEVQRLAENAREATSQIATLVNNIQIETADTVNAMNVAISQVVEGSRLAEQAGDQMTRTQETTAELVAAVQQIAARSQEQARISNDLLDRTQQIQDSTRQTSQQLQEQTIQTTNLVEYAKGLLNSVRVFRLPA